MATYKVGSIEREKRPEPFTVELSDGAEITFADPKQMHWETVVRLDEMGPHERMETLTGDGYAKLCADPAITGEELNGIMAAWREHYGIGTRPGEA